MTTKTFDFAATADSASYERGHVVFFVEGDIQLCMNRHSHSIVIAYLYDKTLKKTIDIPDEFVVYDLTNKCKISKAPGNAQMFVLCWGDDYVFTYKDQEIANLKTLRAWNIRSDHFAHL